MKIRPSDIFDPFAKPEDEGAQCCNEQYSDESLADFMGEHSTVPSAFFEMDTRAKPVPTKR